jgi:hypothetical protein
MFQPGDAIGPRLTLVRKLGQGGMGTVWIADHATLGARVAVKFVSEKALHDPSIIARFASEAAAAARIRSPHVVQVFDHGVELGVPYIVMELLEGESLASLLARAGRLSPQETLAIVRPVCKALAYAHANGVVHRDIKPGNVFIAKTGGETIVKVLDFGLAKIDHTLGSAHVTTRSDALLGTPHYMSPEQMENARAATPRSDLWSLAVLVYRCLAGTPPFHAESVLGLAAAIQEARFEPLSRVRPDLPALDAWLARALAVDPAARFATPHEFETALASAFAGVTDAPTLALTPAPTVTRPRGRKLPVVVALLVLAALAALAVVAVLSAPREETASVRALVVADSARRRVAPPPATTPIAPVASSARPARIVVDAAAPVVTSKVRWACGGGFVQPAYHSMAELRGRCDAVAPAVGACYTHLDMPRAVAFAIQVRSDGAIAVVSVAIGSGDGGDACAASAIARMRLPATDDGRDGSIQLTFAPRE